MVRTDSFKVLTETCFKGLEFTVYSASAIRVCRTSFLGLAVYKVTFSALMMERIIRFQIPPMWGAAAGLNLQTIPFGDSGQQFL